MFTYIIKVTICWLGFYLIYHTFLSKETFFKTNRWYLLATLLLGAGIPLLEFLPIFQEDNPAVVYFQPINEGMYYVQSTVTEVVVESSFDWMQLFWGVYLTGVVVCSARFLYGLGKIYQLYRGAEIISQKTHTLVLTDQPHLPFSFFKYLFWSKDLELNDVDGQKIITHEEAHAEGWHSVDVMLVEIMSIIFWCSPMVYFYKKSMKTVHEYLADAVVLQTTPTKKYGHLLLRQSQSGMQIALANHFFHSQLKQRIVMMTRSKSRKEAIIKYLFAIPVILLLVIVFAKKEAIANMDNNPITTIELTESVFAEQDVDEMPRYPGCEDKATLKEKKECSNHKMLTHIYTNIRYPAEARKAGIQGKVIIKFLVKKDGTITNARVTQEIGGGCGNAALSVIKSLPTMIPGKKDGKNVDVEMLIPVKFKLEGATPSPTNSTGENDSSTKDENEITVVGFQPKKEVIKTYRSVTKTLPNGETVTEQVLVTEDVRGLEPQKEAKTYLIETETLPDGTTVTKKILVDDANQETQKQIRTVTKQLQNGQTSQQDVEVETPVFRVVEDMPRFPGCEDLAGKAEKKKCAEQKMLEFIYSKIKYPVAAREADIQGKVIVEFIIQKDGNVTDAKLLRDIGGDCGEAALEVIAQMPKWIPGKQKGQAVAVKYILPVSFKLQGEKKLKLEAGEGKPLFVIDGKVVVEKLTKDLDPNDIATVNVLKGEKAITKYGKDGENGVVEIITKDGKKNAPKERVYKVVDEMPRFPGCEELTDKRERKKCAENKMLTFIYSNIKYPKEARNAGIQGRAIAQFIIRKDGSISDVNVLRDPGGGCGAESERVLNTMPKWIPGKQNGAPVDVQYTMPISFKLSGKEDAAALEDLTKSKSNEINLSKFNGMLLIVDGVNKGEAKKMEDLKMEDFESINILKGEKATQYGDEGKNGVVVITTKKGSNSTISNNREDALKNAGLDYIKVSPNPTDGKIDIEYGSQNKPMTISIADINGKEIFRKKVDGGRGTLQNVDVSQAAKGMLLVTFQQDGKVYTEKLILQ